MQSCPSPAHPQLPILQTQMVSDGMTGSNPVSPASSSSPASSGAGGISPQHIAQDSSLDGPPGPPDGATVPLEGLSLPQPTDLANRGPKWEKSHAEIAEQAKHEAEIETRIAELRKEGFWSLKRLPKVPEPPRPKGHWDYLCEEMQWLSADFAQERRWKRGVARKVVRMVIRHHEEQRQKEERARREEQAKLRRIASAMAKDVRQFWSNVEKVVQFKQQSRLEEKRKKALDLHLDFIVGQTEKYSDLLSQSLNQPLASSKAGSSPCLGSSSAASSPPPPGARMDDEDGDFQPQEEEEEDDEETIEVEEQQEGNDAETQRREIELLRREGELPLEELLRSLPPQLLGGPSSPSGTPSSHESDTRDGPEEGGEEEPSQVLKVKPPPSVTQRNKQPWHPDEDDEEFTANEDEAEDEEDTIAAEEQLEGEVDHAMELSELAREGELSMEELLQRYAGAYASDASAPGSGSSEEEDEDEVEANSSDCEPEGATEAEEAPQEDSSSQSDSAEEQSEDEDEEHSEEEETSESSESEESESEESEESQSQSQADEEEEEDDDFGVEYLLARDEDQSEADGGSGPPTPGPTTTLGPKKEITDIAAAAESLQPKGYTLATTQVKTPIPLLLRGQLREYQHIGLDWLVTMYEKKLNGILADEMGLGKTIQTISLLAHLACEKGNWGPHLIIVPTSVMLNWEMELKRWCPSFKILTYYGAQKERKLKRQGWTKPNAFHVCITSYKLVLQDHQAFRRKNWRYLILDEAQNIKNFKSQRWQSLLNFNSQRRLLLTGTPLQNSLMELWSLMHFLMPHVFQSHREFKEWFSNPLTGMIEGSQEYNEGLVKRLHKVLRPFLLRRVKVDVEKQMPKKYEHVIRCRLSKRQRCLYDDFMAQTTTKETLATGHFMSVINILMQLRKVCNHPNLFDPRPVTSPFITPGICFSTASLVLRATDVHPLQRIDMGRFDLIGLEGRVSRYEADTFLPQYRLSRRVLLEVATAPDPPPRPKPVKMKVNRMLQPVPKQEGRTVVVVNSPRTPLGPVPVRPPPGPELSAQPTPGPTPPVLPAPLMVSASPSGPPLIPASRPPGPVLLPPLQPNSGPLPQVLPSPLGVLSGTSRPPTPTLSLKPAPPAPVRLSPAPPPGSSNLLKPLTVPPGYAFPNAAATTTSSSTVTAPTTAVPAPAPAPQRLILSPDMQARLPSGEVVSIGQLASLTQRPVASTGGSKPLTFQIQGNKLTLTGAQVRQLAVGQPRPLQMPPTMVNNTGVVKIVVRQAPRDGLTPVPPLAPAPRPPSSGLPAVLTPRPTLPPGRLPTPSLGTARAPIPTSTLVRPLLKLVHSPSPEVSASAPGAAPLTISSPLPVPSSLPGPASSPVPVPNSSPLASPVSSTVSVPVSSSLPISVSTTLPSPASAPLTIPISAPLPVSASGPTLLTNVTPTLAPVVSAAPGPPSLAPVGASPSASALTLGLASTPSLSPSQAPGHPLLLAPASSHVPGLNSAVAPACSPVLVPASALANPFPATPNPAPAQASLLAPAPTASQALATSLAPMVAPQTAILAPSPAPPLAPLPVLAPSPGPTSVLASSQTSVPVLASSSTPGTPLASASSLGPGPAAALAPSSAQTMVPAPVPSPLPSPASTQTLALPPALASTLGGSSPSQTLSLGTGNPQSPFPAQTLSLTPASSLVPAPAQTLSLAPGPPLGPSQTLSLAPAPTLAPVSPMGPAPAHTLTLAPVSSSASLLAPASVQTLTLSPAQVPVPTLGPVAAQTLALAPASTQSPASQASSLVVSSSGAAPLPVTMVSRLPVSKDEPETLTLRSGPPSPPSTATSFSGPRPRRQPPPPPRSPFYLDSLEEKRKRQRSERLERIFQLSEAHGALAPVYGTEVLDFCTLPQPVASPIGPRSPGPSHPTFWTYTEAARQAVLFPQKCKKKPSVMITWMSVDFYTKVLNSCRTLLESVQKPDLETVIDKVVKIYDALMYIQVNTSFEDHILEDLCGMLSLPWICLHSDDDSLKLTTFATSLLTLSQRISDSYSPQAQSQCVFLLTLFPRRIHLEWRTAVYSWALQSSHEVIRTSCINGFFILLQQQNPYNRVPKILVDKVKDDSDIVKKEFASVLGQLVCTLHGKFYLTSSLTEPLSEYGHIDLLCKSLKVASQPECSSSRLKASVCKPFLFLLKKKTPSPVKLAFIENLHHLCKHLDFREDETDVKMVLGTLLNLMEDPDKDVRVAFSGNIKHILESLDAEDGFIKELFVLRMKEAYTHAQISRNNELKDTLILTTGDIGRAAKGDLVPFALLHLLHCLLSKSASVSGAAYTEIRALVAAKSVKLQHFFSQYKKPICQFLVESLHSSQMTALPSTPCQNAEMRKQDVAHQREMALNTLSEIANVFDFPDLNRFLTRTLQVLLPDLAAKASPAASALIRTLGKQLNVNRREILINNFKYIFSHLVCSCSKDELERALHYLKNETEIELGSLLRQDFQGLHNELLLRIGEHYQQVFNGLSILASFASSDDPYQGPRDITSPELMADYLQPKLLGILAFFNMQLLSSSVGIEDKKMALNSLMSLMKLMGPKHVSSVRVKMMTTLRTGLRFKDDFPELCCRAWDCFVRCLDHAYLGSLLSHVIVALLPLIHIQPKETAAIFHYLIIENRDAVQDFLHEIYFLPDHQELKKIKAVLQEYRKETSESTDLQTTLQLSMKAIQHENVDVRIHALTSLKETLYKNQEKLIRYATDSETVEPVISQLVTVLLKGCQDANSQARLLCGECLGELGAIDPGRLDFSTTDTQGKDFTFVTGVEDSNFAYGLLMELTRAYLAYADNSRAQDSAAYAIQELLSIYDCREMQTDGPGHQLWRRFPEHVREILEPHLNTRYKSSQKSTDWSGVKKPIYLSKLGNNFAEWSASWAGYLITKVRHDLASKIFNCCSIMMKHDFKVTIYLLPHILVYVLLGCNQEDQQEVYAEIMAVLKHDDHHTLSTQDSASDLCQLSTQTVFSMLDHLTQWARHKFQALNAEKFAQGKSNRDKVDSVVSTVDYEDYQSVTRFLDLIPQDTLAVASFRSKAYTRAVMHFESFITEKKQNIQEHLGFLQKLYAAMHEPDGVAGVSAIRKAEPSLKEQILEHESIGLLRDATACYDRAIQLEPDQIIHYHGVVKSMLGLGQLSTVITQVNGVHANRSEWTDELNTYRVEAAWKLSQWDLVENYLAADGKSTTWSVRLGQLLLSAKKRDTTAFYDTLKLVRAEQIVPLSAASFERGSYQRGYEYIVRLHMLCELEHSIKPLLHQSPADSIQEDSLNWVARLEMTQNSYRAKEPILALRRALLSLNKRPDYSEMVGECWLQSARVARKAGHHQTAYNALLNAGDSRLAELYVERAKWLWSKGDVHQALIVLQKGVELCFPENKTPPEGKNMLIHGRATLLVGRFMEETANFESNAVMKKYKDVTLFLPEWEDGHFYLAKYYDKLMPMVTDNKMEKQGDLIRYILLHFGRSLQYGNQFIYQSMPRMLSLWLDFGAKAYEWEKAGRSDRVQMRNDLVKINKVITEHTNQLAPYQFLTAFSQLISRICHSHDEVFVVLMEIIAKVFLAYPQQAMWMMTAVSKSSYPMRVNRCKEILNKAIEMKKSLEKFVGDATRLTDKLLELCNKSVDGSSSTLSMRTHFKMLKRLVEEATFSEILIPLQSVMIPTLPSIPGAHANHEPFPGHWAYIAGFDDTVEILASLQKPKKISLKGSDGKFYIMMCKPKDDLRKDCRLMEFNSLINKCLRKDAESRRRELHIRTYAVIPLNDECGIIEWVNNTAGLRPILTKLYKEKGVYMTGKELRQCMLPKSAALSEKLKVFQEFLLPRHPPVFHEWFLRTFPDPTSWYSSRSAYCRSTAVMSMVGYILGLGDRHGENILFDSLTGECVHVDFNCLFNKGETFEVPEIVPFRLTHNMVNGMGPMGTEGLFRRACEVTMRLMRDQREPLMSVLKTFLHDPLVEWSKPVKGHSKAALNETGEVVNEKAKTHVLDIEQRLQGVIKTRNRVTGLPLSIEGHVHYLIQEATDENLLCQMYLGWTPYM